MYIQQVYTQFFVQQHFTDLDSVGRRRATGLHKLGARYPVPLKTNADDDRIGWSDASIQGESANGSPVF
jgi:hypothetical protein